MRSYSLELRLPVVENVSQTRVERMLSCPARIALQLPRAAADAPLLGAAQPQGILFERCLDAGELQQSYQKIADRLFRSRADVVYLAALALLEQQEVRLHDVAHIGEVARHVDVAGADDRRAESLADLDDLAREVGNDEPFALARPDVVERSRHHDRERLALAPLIAKRLGCRLAYRVGTAWPQRRGFVDRQFVRRHETVAVAGPDEEEPTREAGRFERLEKIKRTKKVALVGLARAGE